MVNFCISSIFYFLYHFDIFYHLLIFKESSVDWTKDDEEQLKTFCKNHPSMSKNDERGRKARDKLWAAIRSELGDKYSGDLF